MIDMLIILGALFLAFVAPTIIFSIPLKRASMLGLVMIFILAAEVVIYFALTESY